MAAEVFLGPVADIEMLLQRRGEGGKFPFVTSSVEELHLDQDGIVEAADFPDRHRGQFVRIGVRDNGFDKGGAKSERPHKINTRQLSIIDTASINRIAEGMEIDADVIASYHDMSVLEYVAGRIGANVVLSDAMQAFGDKLTLNKT